MSKDNVIQFPMPKTITISFDGAAPLIYSLTGAQVDFSGTDTLTATIPVSSDYMYTDNGPVSSDYWYTDEGVTVTDPVEMLEAEMVRQMELDLDED